MSFFSAFDENREKMSSLIRCGEVTAVSPEKHTARVTFDDEDGMTSYDLPVLSRNTYANRDYNLPDLGEDVVCLFLSSGTEEGFIIGSFYAGEVTPPENDPNKRTVIFSDETRVSYDRSVHELTIEIEGTKIVANRQDVYVETTNNVTFIAGQKVNISAGTLITMTAPNIALNGLLTANDENGNAGSWTIKGDIKHEGSMQTSQDINVGGDVTAGSISLKNHTHTCPDGETSAPN